MKIISMNRNKLSNRKIHFNLDHKIHQLKDLNAVTSKATDIKNQKLFFVIEIFVCEVLLLGITAARL